MPFLFGTEFQWLLKLILQVCRKLAFNGKKIHSSQNLLFRIICNCICVYIRIHRLCGHHWLTISFFISKRAVECGFNLCFPLRFAIFFLLNLYSTNCLSHFLSYVFETHPLIEAFDVSPSHRHQKLHKQFAVWFRYTFTFIY